MIDFLRSRKQGWIRPLLFPLLLFLDFDFIDFCGSMGKFDCLSDACSGF